MKIEFDQVKNARNIEQRNLSFEQVSEFDFETAAITQDTRHDYGQERYVAVGYIAARLYVVCFTPTTQGIRVISFRKANQREVKDYEYTRTTD